MYEPQCRHCAPQHEPAHQRDVVVPRDDLVAVRAVGPRRPHRRPVARQPVDADVQKAPDDAAEDEERHDPEGVHAALLSRCGSGKSLRSAGDSSKGVRRRANHYECGVRSVECGALSTEYAECGMNRLAKAEDHPRYARNSSGEAVSLLQSALRTPHSALICFCGRCGLTPRLWRRIDRPPPAGPPLSGAEPGPP